MTSLLPHWVQRLSEADRAEVVSEYEERAAIREFDGGAVRFQAEIAAWKDVAIWWKRESRAVREERFREEEGRA